MMKGMKVVSVISIVSVQRLEVSCCPQRRIVVISVGTNLRNMCNNLNEGKNNCGHNLNDLKNNLNGAVNYLSNNLNGAVNYLSNNLNDSLRNLENLGLGVILGNLGLGGNYLRNYSCLNSLGNLCNVSRNYCAH